MNLFSKALASLFILGLILTTVSCGSDESTVSIDEYIQANNLTTQVTASGLHYIIKTPGSAEKPKVSSNITINYKGYLLNGKEFDSGNSVTFPLSNLILGWQEGLQLVGSGGSIVLLIPANLAYGSRGAGSSVPPNTPIGFDIDLISFN